MSTITSTREPSAWLLSSDRWGLSLPLRGRGLLWAAGMRRGWREGEPRSRNCSLELQAKILICSHPLLSFLSRRSQGDSVFKPHLLSSKELKVRLGPEGCTGVGWGESLHACRTHGQVVGGLPGNSGATLLFMQALQSSKEPVQGCRHLQQTAHHTWPGGT